MCVHEGKGRVGINTPLALNPWSKSRRRLLCFCTLIRFNKLFSSSSYSVCLYQGAFLHVDLAP